MEVFRKYFASITWDHIYNGHFTINPSSRNNQSFHRLIQRFYWCTDIRNCRFYCYYPWFCCFSYGCPVITKRGWRHASSGISVYPFDSGYRHCTFGDEIFRKKANTFSKYRGISVLSLCGYDNWLGGGRMRRIIKRYRFPLLTIIVLILLYFYKGTVGLNAIKVSTSSLKAMMLVIPPIFILMGLLDTWVPKEIMVKYMGETSGWKGIFLAFLIGSVAAGPLYASFPVAAAFMKKGVKFRNIMILIGAWSSTKIPMLLFEMSSLGSTFALTRLLINVPGIILTAFLLEAMTSKEQKADLYQKAERL